MLEAQAETTVTLEPCKHVLECASSWLLLRVKGFAESQRVWKYYNMCAHTCGEQVSPEERVSLTWARLCQGPQCPPQVRLRGLQSLPQVQAVVTKG